MDVNKEAQVETKKRNAWVLTHSSRVASGEQEDAILATYMEKPTIMDLACYFDENSDELKHGYVAGALSFLNDLVSGSERFGRHGWYTLEEVTER